MVDRYQIVCASDKGMVRSGNEDAVYGDESLGFAILADGMGGYAAGEVASRLAVDEIRAELESALPHINLNDPGGSGAALAEDLRFAAQRANTAIINSAKRDPDQEGMGATLVLAVLMAGRVVIGHLGDSRAYRFRDGRVEQLTRDHCWVDEQIAQGALQIDALLNTKFKNIVTRALGIDDEIDLEVHEHETLPGDTLLMCSDGLTDMLDDGQIEALLRGNGDLPAKADQLIAQANQKGGKDNISVVLMRVAASKGGWASRLVRKIQGVSGSAADEPPPGSAK